MYDPAGRQHRGPLVGREEELRELHQQFEIIERLVGQELQANRFEVLARRSYGVFLLGEAGIGKTRLAEELARWVLQREWAVIWNRAYEQEQIVPYWMWSKVLRSCMQLDLWRPEEEDSPALFLPLTKLLPELAARLPADENLLAPSSEQEPFLLWEAVLAVFQSMNRQAPVLLVLDDVHWADEGSCKLLGYLLRRLVGSRVLMLGTCRQEEFTGCPLDPLLGHLQRERLVTTLHVHALSNEQMHRLLSSFPGHFSDAIIQRIQRQAAGNPFFAEELAYGASMDAEPRLPKSIAGAFGLRLERLSPACQRLLSKAAVLGGSFDVNLISALEESMSLFASEGKSQHSTVNEDMFDLLEEAMQAGILTEAGAGTHITFSFWHPLMVTHLYENLSAVRRRKLHRQAAKVLQRVYAERLAEQAAIITHHLLKAGASAQDIVYYAELAGDHAYALSSYPEAEKHYRIVLEYLRIPSQGSNDHPRKDRLIVSVMPLVGPDGHDQSVPAGMWEAEGVGGVAEPDGELDKLVSAEVIDNLNGGLSDEQLRRVELLELLGECARMQGKYEEARQIYEQALYFRQQQPMAKNSAEYQRESQIQALLWCEIGWTWYDLGKHEQVRQCYRRGEEILQEAGVVAGPVWTYIRYQQGYVSWREGRYEEAHSQANEVLSLFEVLPEQPSHAIGNNRRLTRIGRILAGDPIILGRTHALLGLIANGAGKSAEALCQYNEALTLYEQHNIRREIAVVCCNLGDFHLRRAEYALAQANLRRSLNLAELVGEVPLVSFSLYNLGILDLRLGNLANSESELRRSIDVSANVYDPISASQYYTTLGTILLEQSNLVDAGIALCRALSISRDLHIMPCIGSALVAIGEMRIAQAIAVGFERENKEKVVFNLKRAKKALLRALVLEEMEAETRTEGRVALGQAMLLLDDVEQAHNVAIQALEEAQQFELTWLIARAQRVLGCIHAAQKQEEQAVAYFEQALDIFRKTGMRLEYARTLQQYGEMLACQVDVSEEAYQRGLGYLREAREMFEASGATLDLRVVERVLDRCEL
jgi:tetratricopeptide (TPR) repeat protein